MRRIKHVEQHFTSSNFVRDMVIGMSDGLTVPFALAAGLSGAVSNTRLIVIGSCNPRLLSSRTSCASGRSRGRENFLRFDQPLRRSVRL